MLVRLATAHSSCLQEPPVNFPPGPPLHPSACQGNAAVRTQLCLAIAALAAHLPAVQWGQQGVVGWLAQRLGGEAQTVSLPCMLELLTVLPQVCGVQGAGLSQFAGGLRGLGERACPAVGGLLGDQWLLNGRPQRWASMRPTAVHPRVAAAAGGEQLPAGGAARAAAAGAGRDAGVRAAGTAATGCC